MYATCALNDLEFDSWLYGVMVLRRTCSIVSLVTVCPVRLLQCYNYDWIEYYCICSLMQ